MKHQTHEMKNIIKQTLNHPACECLEERQCTQLTSACVNSCTRPDAVETCELPKLRDKCVCKDADQVVFQGRCVSKEDCGCYDQLEGTEHQVI